MSAKNFIITSFTGLILILAAYALVVDKMLIIERKVPYSYKQFTLQVFSKINGKVIVMAGSNAIHGIDSISLSEYFNAPVFTYADNASYPFREKIYSIERFISTGDIILLPLEWSYYSAEQHLSDNYINMLADKKLRLEFYFNNLPILEKLRFTYTQYPLMKVMQGLMLQRSNIDLLQSDLLRLNYFQGVVESGKIAMLGNSTRNGPENIIKSPRSAHCDDYLFSGGFKVSSAFKSSLLLLQKLTKKGVSVYFTWPATVDYKESHCYQKNITHKIEIFSTEIKDLVVKAGFQFIDNEQQSHFPAHCFLNTYYHLKRECAILRTNRLINSIKYSEITPINNTSDMNVALMLNKVITVKRNEVFDELIDLLPELKKGKITAWQLSHNLIFRQGWGIQEKWGVWSEGRESTLSFKINKSLLTKKYIKITIKGRYFNGNEKTRVNINSLDYAEKELINTVFRVPVNSIDNNRIDITLQHRSVLSAAELELSRDTRKIKFGLTELVIEADDQGK